jgi:hypothetical protein
MVLARPNCVARIKVAKPDRVRSRPSEISSFGLTSDASNVSQAIYLQHLVTSLAGPVTSNPFPSKKCSISRERFFA